MGIDLLRYYILLPMVNGLMRLNIYLSNVLKNYVVRTNSKDYKVWNWAVASLRILIDISKQSKLIKNHFEMFDIF